MGSQGAMKETIILTNFEFSSTIIGKVSHLSGGFSGTETIRSSLGEKRKLRAARGSGITATS